MSMLQGRGRSIYQSQEIETVITTSTLQDQQKKNPITICKFPPFHLLREIKADVSAETSTRISWIRAKNELLETGLYISVLGFLHKYGLVFTTLVTWIQLKSTQRTSLPTTWVKARFGSKSIKHRSRMVWLQLPEQWTMYAAPLIFSFYLNFV